MSGPVGAPPRARRRPGRPPGPSQAPQLRARLVEEASQLYAAGGYAGISFATVAQRSDLTKATVFHYFPSKDALLRAVFEAFGERLERAAENWFDPPPPSHAARLERLVESLVDFYGRDPLNARILCHGLLETEFEGGNRRSASSARRAAQERTAANGSRAPSPPHGIGAAPPVFDHFVRRFVEFIASGIAAEEFYPERPLATIMAIGGIVLFEFMLPDQGRTFRGGSAGRVSLTARGREMAAVINRAVVRPGVRLRRRRRAKGAR
jgi:AcrR family transcriptional regulator